MVFSLIANKKVAAIFSSFLLFIGILITVFSSQQKTNNRQYAGGNINTTVDTVVSQTLTDENTNGWDTTAANLGILVNWRQDDLTKVNCGGSTCDVRGSTTRHDTANDLRALENLYWYKFHHPTATSIDRYIAQILPLVKNEWGNTTLGKGWIYYVLQRLIQYSGDNAYWTTDAQNWAAAQYKAIDPALGIEHGS